MKTSANGRALIESFEGLILQAYDDANDKIVKPGSTSKGTLTIGYGHTTAAGPPRVYVGQKITKQQADEILASDLSKVEDDVTRLVKVPVTQNQFDALVSFHFNTGGLGRSSVLKLLNQKDYTGAANALLQWNRGNGQVLKGLVIRRQAEKDLFLKSDAKVGGHAAAAVVVGGTTAMVATQASQHEVGWVIGIGAAVVIGIIMYAVHLYRKHNVIKT